MVCPKGGEQGAQTATALSERLAVASGGALCVRSSRDRTLDEIRGPHQPRALIFDRKIETRITKPNATIPGDVYSSLVQIRAKATRGNSWGRQPSLVGSCLLARRPSPSLRCRQAAAPLLLSPPFAPGSQLSRPLREREVSVSRLVLQRFWILGARARLRGRPHHGRSATSHFSALAPAIERMRSSSAPSAAAEPS